MFFRSLFLPTRTAFPNRFDRVTKTHVTAPIWTIYTENTGIRAHLLSPHAERMQMVKTDSVKAQNQVGLPIGAPGTIFFSIIPPLRSGRVEIKLQNFNSNINNNNNK